MMKKRIPCQNGIWLKKIEGNFGEIQVWYSPRCKSKKCPTCRKAKRSKFIMRIISAYREDSRFSTWRFITLTLWGRMHNDKVVAKKMAQKFWEKFRKRLMRIGEVCYVKVWELHKSGIPHIHLILGVGNDIYISRKKLKKMAIQCGFGHQIKDVDLTEESVIYVSKYVAKENGLFVRSTEFSRNFYKIKEEQTYDEDDSESWIYIGKVPCILKLVKDLEKAGVQVYLLNDIESAVDLEG